MPRRKLVTVHLVNRTTHPLNAMWDGVPYVIHPGYVVVEKKGGEIVTLGEDDLFDPKVHKAVAAKAVRDRRGVILRFEPDTDEGAQPFHEPFEYAVARAACLQNRRMGTEAPDDPTEFESLCGVLEWENEIDHCEQSDADETIDRSQLPEDLRRVKRVGRSKAAGKKRRRFRIEQYGGGSGNPTGMYVPGHP